MKLFEKLGDITTFPRPCALTIGSFDGVHLGHRHLFQYMRSLVLNEGTVGILSFRNHPSHVLNNGTGAPLICTLEQKISLLEKAHVDLLILLSFTKELSELSYDAFLREVHAHFPFSYLILGKGATIGKKREGDEHKLKALGQFLGFEAIFIEKFSQGEMHISSRKIREHLERGELKMACALLGRPYSILGSIIPDPKDPKFGHILLEGRVFPPEGSYQVQLFFRGEIHTTIAHIQKKNHLLNIEIPSSIKDFSKGAAEVIFSEMR